MVVEQKIIFWKREDIDLIGSQLKEQIEKHCVDGFVVHQIQPTHWTEYCGGCQRLSAAVIVLQREKKSEKDLLVSK